METNELNIERRYGFFRIFRIVGLVIGGVIIAVFLAFIFGYFVMLLWNWLMPLIFGLPEITYWHAFGIIILARLLFGGHNPGHDHKREPSSRQKTKFINWLKYGKSRAKSADSHKWNNWKYYDQWWTDEGEKGFSDYVNKKKEEEE